MEARGLRHFLLLTLFFLTVALLTGNPIPIMLGLVAFAATPEKLKQENENAESFNTETKRAANIETVGLLDEAE